MKSPVQLTGLLTEYFDSFFLTIFQIGKVFKIVSIKMKSRQDKFMIYCFLAFRSVFSLQRIAFVKTKITRFFSIFTAFTLLKLHNAQLS